MTPEMITAIAAFVAALGGILSAALLHRKTTALLEYRLGEVEKKLDTHNGYAKLFSESSERIAAIEKDVAVIKTSIDFIRDEVEKNEKN